MTTSMCLLMSELLHSVPIADQNTSKKPVDSHDFKSAVKHPRSDSAMCKHPSMNLTLRLASSTRQRTWPCEVNTRRLFTNQICLSESVCMTEQNTSRHERQTRNEGHKADLIRRFRECMHHIAVRQALTDEGTTKMSSESHHTIYGHLINSEAGTADAPETLRAQPKYSYDSRAKAWTRHVPFPRLECGVHDVNAALCSFSLRKVNSELEQPLHVPNKKSHARHKANYSQRKSVTFDVDEPTLHSTHHRNNSGAETFREGVPFIAVGESVNKDSMKLEMTRRHSSHELYEDAVAPSNMVRLRNRAPLFAVVCHCPKRMGGCGGTLCVSCMRMQRGEALQVWSVQAVTHMIGSKDQRTRKNLRHGMFKDAHVHEFCIS